MTTIAAPRNFSQAARYLVGLWRAEGTLPFVRLSLALGRERSVAGEMWKYGLLVGLASFAFVAFMRLAEGGAAFNTASDGVNWGMAVAVYAFFALTSSGLTFIASLPMVFGFREYY